MTEFWQMFTALTFIITAWGMIILVVVRFAFVRFNKDLEKRDKTFDEKIEKRDLHFSEKLKERDDCFAEKLSKVSSIEESNNRLVREVLEMKADLPLNYVRKEDFIRHEVVINTKLDRLRDLLVDNKKEQ